MINEQGLDVIQPKAVLTSSEKLTDEMHNTLKTVYRCPVLLLQPEMFDYWYSYLSSFAPKYKKTNPPAPDKKLS